MIGKAPVALFVYNRPEHTRLTVEALLKNDGSSQTDLIVFCDGARDSAANVSVSTVRQFIRNIDGFRSVRIVERTDNLGLANSIISGVTLVCAEYGRVIVVEDDLVTSPAFLRYMNDALCTYERVEEVGSIHGYWYPVTQEVPETFFLRGASCWGWATWQRAWRRFEPDGTKLLSELRQRKLTKRFDLDGAIGYTRMLQDQIAGRNDSWAIRWHASTFLGGLLQLSPGRSLVQNIGFDGSGTHCAESEVYTVSLTSSPVSVGGVDVAESAQAREVLAQYHRSTRRTLVQRILGRLGRIARN